MSHGRKRTMVACLGGHFRPGKYAFKATKRRSLESYLLDYNGISRSDPIENIERIDAIEKEVRPHIGAS
jgi:hypothetical protein